MAHLSNGSVFKEFTFKTEHRAVEDSLPLLCQSLGIRSAKIVEGQLHVSDGLVLSVVEVQFVRV